MKLYLRLMRLPRLAPATIQQGLRSCHAGSIRRMRFIHDGSERLYRLFGVHSCQRRDFERSFSHLNSPRLPAAVCQKISALARVTRSWSPGTGSKMGVLHDTLPCSFFTKRPPAPPPVVNLDMDVVSRPGWAADMDVVSRP